MPTVEVVADWTSLIPPIIAIGLALWLRSVIPAMVLAIWSGLILEYGFSPQDIFRALLDTFQVRMFDVMVNPDHVAVLLFTGMIGGMVGVISQNGGMHGVVDIVLRFAHNARRGQLSVWFLGLCIFFDDYTNTLVVGNSVRPVTDKLRISREKLAYIVDSTAAPVACIAVLTTWIGYELGIIGKSIEGLEGLEMSAIAVFLNSIPYSFYPMLAIFFVFLVASGGRDFGPMLAAERRSRETGQVAPPPSALAAAGEEELNTEIGDDIPRRAANAVIPILTLILGSVIGLYVTGEGDGLRERLGSADVYQALMWGSFMGAAVAGGLTWGQQILSLHGVVGAWTKGVNVMVAPLMILVLAWALSDTTASLGTADFLVSLAGDALLPQLIPAITFLLAAAAAFATGSSWGVIAILLPLVIPVTWAAMINNNLLTPADMPIFYAAVASVLCGSVWGDHCSPISDTTVLSSLASGCDHIEHVRTQMPYALLVGVVAELVCLVPVGFGLPWWLTLLVAVAALIGLMRFFGSSSGEQKQDASGTAEIG
jgi:Na+/H+ antiporter NhaC